MADDTPALRVQFFGAPPEPAQRYWRGPVLTAFDGRRWTREPASARRPAAVVEAGTQGWDYQIDYEPTDRRQLVALDLPSGAPAGSMLDADMSLRSERPLASLSRWRLHSAPPAVRQHAVAPSAPRAAAGRLQPAPPPWPSNGDRTPAVMTRPSCAARCSGSPRISRTRWIPRRRGATRSTSSCSANEHFSSAFVVLMRNAGVPARW